MLSSHKKRIKVSEIDVARMQAQVKIRGEEMINLLLIVFCVMGLAFAAYVESLNRKTERLNREKHQVLSPNKE